MSDKIDLQRLEQSALHTVRVWGGIANGFLSHSEAKALGEAQAMRALVRVARAAMVVHSAGLDAMPDDWIEMAEALAAFTDSAKENSSA